MGLKNNKVLPETQTGQGKSAKNWKTTSRGIVFEKRSCLISKKAKLIAVLFGFAVAGCIIGGLYIGGVFSNAPRLADNMEGEADFSSEDGSKEIYNLKIDFNKGIIQLTLLQEIHPGQGRHRRDLNSEENVALNMTKIVVQDYKNKKKYFIIPGKNSTTKCLKSDLKGEMIPRDLLKHAKNEKIPDDLKRKILLRLRFGDNSQADVLVPANNESQNIVYKGSDWNMTMHDRKANEFNLTDVSKMECFDYKEESNVIQKEFYVSKQAKYILENLSELPREEIERISNSLNLSSTTAPSQQTNHIRQRRGILDSLTKWSHGNWCGAYTGGYENHCKKQKGVCRAPYTKVHDQCKQCCPVVDEIDGHCMEHDRCLMEHGPGPSACLPQGNRCICDFNLYLGAVKSATMCSKSGQSDCASASRTISIVFSSLLSCWFPTKVCFNGLKVQCGCSACSCPSVKTVKTCISFKFCVPFGSGKVHW
eukprot:Seg689.2 transcript_id=Seg689.2/GoldUCD/mRNA.D3Y31 product="hypothetical protein" protein_id=Seg689.2/GoldUCD/D3Y31